ncbi:hypothetical protein M5K25_016497 [Dendrobium thyrsiflorum]|uniref:Uncharacterized protein n=1 Tax=Dendrobium thyrsiflorum TaxID=117978 RepID=A0ABD0UK92_DENTH
MKGTLGRDEIGESSKISRAPASLPANSGRLSPDFQWPSTTAGFPPNYHLRPDVLLDHHLDAGLSLDQRLWSFQPPSPTTVLLTSVAKSWSLRPPSPVDNNISDLRRPLTMVLSTSFADYGLFDLHHQTTVCLTTVTYRVRSLRSPLQTMVLPTSIAHRQRSFRPSSSADLRRPPTMVLTISFVDYGLAYQTNVSKPTLPCNLLHQTKVFTQGRASFVINCKYYWIHSNWAMPRATSSKSNWKLHRKPKQIKTENHIVSKIAKILAEEPSNAAADRNQYVSQPPENPATPFLASHRTAGSNPRLNPLEAPRRTRNSYSARMVKPKLLLGLRKKLHKKRMVKMQDRNQVTLRRLILLLATADVHRQKPLKPFITATDERSCTVSLSEIADPPEYSDRRRKQLRTMRFEAAVPSRPVPKYPSTDPNHLSAHRYGLNSAQEHAKKLPLSFCSSNLFLFVVAGAWVRGAI